MFWYFSSCFRHAAVLNQETSLSTAQQEAVVQSFLKNYDKVCTGFSLLKEYFKGFLPTIDFRLYILKMFFYNNNN